MAVTAPDQDRLALPVGTLMEGFVVTFVGDHCVFCSLWAAPGAPVIVIGREAFHALCADHNFRYHWQAVPGCNACAPAA